MLSFVDPRGLANLASTCTRFGGRNISTAHEFSSTDYYSLVEKTAKLMIEKNDV